MRDPLLAPLAAIAAGILVSRFVLFEIRELLAVIAALVLLGVLSLWRQNRVLAARRAGRDEAAVRAALVRMVQAARGEDNIVPAMLDAARVEATLGEICDALREQWGTYMEPARF